MIDARALPWIVPPEYSPAPTRPPPDVVHVADPPHRHAAIRRKIRLGTMMLASRSRRRLALVALATLVDPRVVHAQRTTRTARVGVLASSTEENFAPSVKGSSSGRLTTFLELAPIEVPELTRGEGR
jgi:hypothetical protein